MNEPILERPKQIPPDSNLRQTTERVMFLFLGVEQTPL